MTAVCEQLLCEAAVPVPPADRAHLVRAVNAFYHELTQGVFDREHRYRHRIERGFWHRVAELLPSGQRDADSHAQPRGRVIVDLACGTGFVSEILCRHLVSTDRLIAIDLSPAALASTHRKCTRADMSGSLLRFSGDSGRLPLADASVDLLAINAALHHMPEIDAVLAEVDRVLQPGGWFALGFEPNLHHFESRGVCGLARNLDRLTWYASPRENLRRVSEWLRRSNNAARLGATEYITNAINHRLRGQQGCGIALTTGDLLDLVDPHARGAEKCAGFDPRQLIDRHFAGYRVHTLFTCDYLGESVRRFKPLRDLADALYRRLLPDHGSLFSWILRKPMAGGVT